MRYSGERLGKRESMFSCYLKILVKVKSELIQYLSILTTVFAPITPALLELKFGQRDFLISTKVVLFLFTQYEEYCTTEHFDRKAKLILKPYNFKLQF